jgi:hypothetical protein
MVQLEVWSPNHSEWHAQLRDTTTWQRIGYEWIAEQRGAVIGLARKWLPLSHLNVVDVASPNY